MKSVFVDSNVVYGLDLLKPERRAVAQTWLKTLARSGGLTMNPQVLNESYAMLTLKLRLDPEDVRPPRGMGDPEPLRRAHMGGLLLAAANLVGCTHFLSEDEQRAALRRRSGRQSVSPCAGRRARPRPLPLTPFPETPWP